MITLRHIAPGIGAIALAASILLLSDLPKAPRTEKVFRVALLQMASQPILEDGAAGVIAGLQEAGYVDGRTLRLSRFNAEGDLATANAMAQELTGSDFDLVVTLSTPCLQAVANANRRGQVRHVFGMVSDPSIAGVGIGKEPPAHPPHLVGIGTLPPADLSLQLARQVYPGLQRVGVVWNPAEINSEIATKMARQTCKELQIELLEANAENTASVREAAASLIARDVDALWVGGDVTVLGAIEVVIRVAKQAKIPVFTCIPGNAAQGTLFDIGANYYEVGRSTGKLAARVLSGEAMASLPWETAIPPKLFLNTTVPADLKAPWVFPADLIAKADTVIDATGEHTKAASPPVANAAPRPLTKVWRLRLTSYINSADAEDAERGVQAGLKAAGLVEGRDYDWKSLNAQGDMAALNGLVDAALADQADLLLTVSTQALQAAVQRAKDVPIVFTMVANPFMAGVGTSDRDHRPRVTGAYGAADAEAMMPLIRQVLPNTRRLGTLYSPTEVNSVFNHDVVAAAAKKAGWPLVSVGVNTPSEVLDATQSLCGQDIDALCLTNSNLAGACFPSVVQATRRAKVPVFGFLGSLSKQGAVVVLTRDYFDMGRESGQLAARVMRGEAASSIPFHPSTQNRLLINKDAARECGLTLPDTRSSSRS
ncbi:MAG: ABC transporter substrate-binding protein, partial [Planctomycetaceae bacterium]|nr:ABC transporter substrate-binding protein [Planctomycetaceae bacterium]